MLFGTIQDSLLSLIFPQTCHLCAGTVDHTADGVVCDGCWSATRFFDQTELLCAKCGAFFGEKAAPKPVYCHHCDDHFYDRAVALGPYEKALAAVIINLKTQPVIPARVLSRFSLPGVMNTILSADVIIPVPLSPQRKLERRFNQAETIARAIARLGRKPIDNSSLARTTHTPIHRGGMDQKARDLSVRRSFKVVRPKLVAGRHILLTDDVLTSGSTASYCALELKRAGAKSVNVLTLARAIRHSY